MGRNPKENHHPYGGDREFESGFLHRRVSLKIRADGTPGRTRVKLKPHLSYWSEILDIYRAAKLYTTEELREMQRVMMMIAVRQGLIPPDEG